MSLFARIQPGAFVALVLAGCSSSEATWKDALGQIDLGQSVFSLAYVAAPPDGTFLTMAAQAGRDAASACSAYETQQLPADFWYLGIDTTSTPAGSYAAVDRISPPSAVPLATVELVHVRSGSKVETVAALSGDVTIDTAPQDAQEWHDGSDLHGTISVAFPSESWREYMCAGGQGAGQPEAIVTSCDCVGPNDRTAQCTPETPTENCCAKMGAAAGTTPFSATIVAGRCPWMCKFTDPALARECLALQ
jgi:hypothetical protein